MIRLVCLCVTLAWGGMADAQGRDTVRAYFFGNSLINHAGGGAETAVPFWLDRIAEADGRTLALDGQFGFLRDFARSLPPTANWGFPGVSGAWNPDATAFRDAGFTDIVLNPANFIQYQPPDAPFDGAGADGTSPLAATLAVFDWVAAQGGSPRFHVYEGWAEMAGIVDGFPPDAAGLARYHAANGGAYHDWYEAYVGALNEARPDMRIALIPVASILAEILSQPPLDALPAGALYEDDAPHGTPTVYFLAALITYAWLYEALPPLDLAIPESVAPEVAAAYPRILDTIAARMPAPTEARAPEPAAPAPAVEKPSGPPLPRALPAADADTVPALGMGLNGIADWSTQHPFLDVMKTAREWVGHLPGQWGGVSAEDLRAGGHLDPDGWPISLPDEVDRIEALIFTDQPEDADHLRGTYRMLYDGQGDLELTGRARRVREAPGGLRFRYDPGDGLVGLAIRAVDPDDPIRNIRVIREDHLPLVEAGALFNPDWIARVQDLRSVRFMDWMFTNGSPQTGWDTRPRMADYTWTSRGVPLPVMLRLANLIGADPWFTLPHMADDAHIRAFAEAVRDGLDPRLRAYVEYSNEVWNFIFPQAQWAAARAEEKWGASQTGWMQFYGLRAAQVMDIWTEVFGPEASDRLVRVVATHTGWPELEEDILIAPLALLELGRAPVESFDAYAVTGYFGYELGGEEMAPQMQAWLDRSEQTAREEGEAEGLRRVALREYVRERRFDAAFAPVTQALLDGSLRDLVQEVLPYHAEVAEAQGLRLVMYEGGTHVAAQGPLVDDERLTDFFTRYNYTDDMAALYEVLLTGWVRAGGTLFNAFVDVAPATRWGSWGALRHLGDSNPRWDVLMEYNATAPSDWADRDPAAFANGVFRQGDGRLEGTAEEDILIGGDGPDVLVSNGGADRLHGGGGDDLAILKGVAGTYAFRRENGLLVAEGPDGTLFLRDVERLAFDAPAELELRAEDL